MVPFLSSFHITRKSSVEFSVEFSILCVGFFLFKIVTLNPRCDLDFCRITTSGSHNITDVYSLGKVTFVALLGTVTLEVALVARYWTWVFFWFVVLSYVLVYPYMVIFPLLELAVGYYDPANVGVAYQVLASPSFWFIIILCYMITFGARFAERTWLWTFRPHDTMILTEKEAVARAKGETFFSEVSGASKKRLMALGSIQSSSVKPKSKKDKRRGGDQRPAVVVAEDVAYVGQGKGKGLANVNGGDQIMKDSSGIETGTPRRRVADSAALRRLHTSSDTSLTEVGEASEHSGDTFEFTRPGSLDDGRDSDSMKKWDSLKPLPK